MADRAIQKPNQRRMKMNKKLLRTSPALAACLLLMLSCAAKAEQTTDYEKSQLFIPSSDTIRLATDLYLPKAAGPFSCILIRTPYNKNGEKGTAESFIRQGYAVVAQDCRGTGKSNCRFYAFRFEREDGLATTAWIRRQPWSNGRIGGWGGSYVGYTQWVIADQLDAIAGLVTTADMHDGLFPNGIFSLALANNWGLLMNNPKIKPDQLLASYRILPLSQADDSTGASNAFYDDWLRHPQKDDYWQALAFRKPITTPVFSVAGWYDIFLESQIKDFLALAPKRHPASRLIIGPFAHGKITIATDYGEAAKLDRPIELARSFLLQTVKHPVGLTVYADSLMNKPFACFIIHANRWVLSDHWPPEQSAPTNYYLSNQHLSQQMPQLNDQQEYTCNPLDPYPSLGGTFLGIGVGPAWQNANAQRADQLAFEGETLTKPLTLLGPLQANLWVNSDAACSEFYACLQDVQPDSQIVNIQEGGTKFSGDGKEGARQLAFSMWATGYQLAAGHKMRLVVCSALFPRYNRTLGNCEALFGAQNAVTSRQRLFTGPKHPSHLTLSVMPEPAAKNQ
jgi:uncharacterized protein